MEEVLGIELLPHSENMQIIDSRQTAKSPNDQKA
jgi:hypothetical protein